jgi:hypothetical protein
VFAAVLVSFLLQSAPGTSPFRDRCAGLRRSNGAHPYFAMKTSFRFLFPLLVLAGPVSPAAALGERRQEREDLVERRDVFLACLARDKAFELYRHDGGPGKAFGYVIMKQFQSLYHYELGVRAP